MSERTVENEEPLNPEESGTNEQVLGETLEEPEKEEIQFDEPIDFSAYDQFSLEVVVASRLARHNAEKPGLPLVEPNPTAKPKNAASASIASINYEEDEKEIQRVEEIQRALSEKKLAESIAEISIDIEDAKEEDSESEDEEKKIEKKSGATTEPTAEQKDQRSGLLSWVSTAKLPPRVYEKLRPKMAISYPFELDEFQKQAVMRLERRENVFVAAHTSAGKTVVAEYGIALAMKNGSRAVYTSPIKALSNQKYRDFKDKFGVDNVGIVTGDVSVNPQAQCLIMTTEIFRSMLYKGSDTTRDIEFVIFDEVHYVNDAERGVVWEEVIIMLPPTITLIFLSATTPNASDFSDWIGRTKQKQVYLISTNKRPVPLQHFLYFDNEMYKLMQGDTNYDRNMIPSIATKMKEKAKAPQKTAENAKFAAQRQQEKADKVAQFVGKNNPGKQQQMLQQMNKHHGKPGGGGGGGGAGKRPSGGGKGQWTTLIKILQAGGREAAGGLSEIDFGVAKSGKVLSKEARKQKNEQMVKYEDLPKELRAKMSKKEYESTEFRGDENEAAATGEIGLLPVVVFSFSKKRCEELADFFKGQDFLTQKEKSRVESLFSEVLSRLNPLDTDLPQINRLKDMLRRGIGVHHGGLLPILKETVEILFTDSTVKVLFATETFAMGVNMPAKAVIFNGFRKHDGKEFRDLLSGEYIQMAGRAGRRGLDKFGTVIITAWNDLPPELTIKTLLTGRPTLLSSQFRLRYNMILNLVRVNNLTVQQMIKRSFTEFATQRQLANSDIGTKVRKYEMLLNYLKNSIYYLSEEEEEEINNKRKTPKNDESDALEIELERRHAYFNHIHYYVNIFKQCQSLFFEQLLLLYSFATNYKRFDFNAFFSFGRVIQCRTEVTGAPVWAVILTDPATTKKINTEAKEKAAAAAAVAAGKTGKPVKKPLVFEQSAAAAQRAALLGSATAASTPSASAKVDGKGGNDTSAKSVEEMSVWALCLFSDDDLPLWCAGKDVIVEDKISLTSFAENVLYRTDLSHYSLIQVALKDVANVLSPPVTIPSYQGGATTTEISAHEIVAQFIQTINPPQDSTVSNEVSYTNFYKEYKINQVEFTEKRDKLSSLMQELSQHIQQIYQFPHQTGEEGGKKDNNYYSLSRLYPKVLKINQIENKINLLKHIISDESLSLFPDFQQRINLLRSLGYLDSQENVITKKGRVCCELNTCDELLGTEILFHNILEPLNPPEAVAILSALIFQEKNDVEETLTTRMETARCEILELLHQINTLQKLEGIDEMNENFTSQTSNKPIINFGLCSVVYQWARGIPFKEITRMTEFQEGSIVRTITRLAELCRDIQNAARVMGNPSLYYKMEAASECIKRDIVFAASLYLT
eukprot:gene7704-8318_t